jgi:hypothetical protein
MRIVTFTFPMAMFGTKNGAYYGLFEKHFGLDREEVGAGYTATKQEILVECSPASFAEFLIERHQIGLSNQFAVLAPTIRTEPDTKMGTTVVRLRARTL